MCRSDTPLLLPSSLLISGAVAAEALQGFQDSGIRVSCPREFEGVKHHHALWSWHGWRRTCSSMAGNALLSLLTTSSSTSKGEETFGEGCHWGLICLYGVGVTLSPHLVSAMGAVRAKLLCELQKLGWTGVRGRTELSYCSSAVLTTWVLLVLSPCKPTSSHLPAAGDSSSPSSSSQTQNPSGSWLRCTTTLMPAIAWCNVVSYLPIHVLLNVASSFISELWRFYCLF